MIAIIDYGAGNLTSVLLALDSLGIQAEITQDPAAMRAAERVIFPGVGAAGASMRNLNNLGLVDAIRKVVQSGKPFLGICVGAQVSLDFSEEDGGTDCIGLVQGRVKRFAPSSLTDKVPQMGWNSVSQKSKHPVFDNIEQGSEFYFVHSYYPVPDEPRVVLGETDYAGVTLRRSTRRTISSAE